MTKAYEIPTSATPSSFDIQLGALTYRLTLVYNTMSACWVLDIADDQGNAILLGIPVITGLDLLEQYHYAGIPGSIVVQTDFDTDAVPTFENLGTTGHIFYVTEA